MCGQDTSAKDAEASNYNSVKLVKQLEQTENRLITVQEALDEVQYERDMYKSKVRMYHIGFSLSTYSSAGQFNRTKQVMNKSFKLNPFQLKHQFKIM